MKKSNLGLFMIALLFAVIGSGALYFYLKSFETPTPVVNEIETTEVVIAVENIVARTMITESMVSVVSVPLQGLIGTPISTVDEIIGKYAKDNIYKNQQIHPESIIIDLNDELSLKLNGNHRAVTISVNDLSGVNGLVKPGDFVDVVLFLPQTTENNRVRPDIVKLFLQNIEVIAINKNLSRSAPESDSAEDTNYFVTLSVPVMDVEMLVLAKDIGSIEIALRPLEGDYLYVTEGAIWQELLLNDLNQMKDMAPEYEIIGTDENLIEGSNYNYDKYIYYVVEFGDTLRSISEKFYGDENLYTLLQQVNRIDDVDMILTGTGIKVPVLIEGEATNGN